ncbi:MAG TPA: DinB family protein [Streptosporangiaceae bacterium]|nr:DinB family protein [Streptosporangiaceae bacterium]
MDLDWTTDLAEQLDWQWRENMRPRLDSLTDREYFWEPVPGCWSVRPRAESAAPRAVGTGDFVYEFAYPEPEPPPVTTIAWRLAHMIVGVFASRNAGHFGGPPADWENWEYAPTAAAALDQLDEVYAAWIAGVRALDADGLARPCGPAEGPYSDCPLSQLVLHINREALWHGGEICLLRDLYLWKKADHDAL